MLYLAVVAAWTSCTLRLLLEFASDGVAAWVHAIAGIDATAVALFSLFHDLVAAGSLHLYLRKK